MPDTRKTDARSEVVKHASDLVYSEADITATIRDAVTNEPTPEQVRLAQSELGRIGFVYGLSKPSFDQRGGHDTDRKSYKQLANHLASSYDLLRSLLPDQEAEFAGANPAANTLVDAAIKLDYGWQPPTPRPYATSSFGELHRSLRTRDEWNALAEHPDTEIFMLELCARSVAANGALLRAVEGLHLLCSVAEHARDLAADAIATPRAGDARPIKASKTRTEIAKRDSIRKLAGLYEKLTGTRPPESENHPFTGFVAAAFKLIDPSQKITGNVVRKALEATRPS